MEQTRKDHPWTDDELMALSSAGHRVELADGVLHDMSPTGGSHAVVVVTISVLLHRYATKYRAGTVFAAEIGCRLDAANCLAPDVAMVTTRRLPQVLPQPDKFLVGAPDLAVEVLSPDDSWAEAERKVALYFLHGTVQAWVVDPIGRTVRVYTDSRTFVTLSGNDRLPGSPRFPGLRPMVRSFFRDLPDSDGR